MVDAIFILLLCALVFLGIAAAAAFLFLPLVKLFRRKETQKLYGDSTREAEILYRRSIAIDLG